MPASHLAVLTPDGDTGPRIPPGVLIEATVTAPAPTTRGGSLFALHEGRTEGPLAGWKSDIPGIPGSGLVAHDQVQAGDFPRAGDLVWFQRSTRGRLVCVTWATP